MFNMYLPYFLSRNIVILLLGGIFNSFHLPLSMIMSPIIIIIIIIIKNAPY